MVALIRKSLLRKAAIVAIGFLGAVSVLTGCNKSDDQATIPPAQTAPATNGTGGGAPPQTPEQKQAQDAAVARSIAERAAHAPPAPK